MNKVYLSYNNIVSSLGFDSVSVVDRINEEVSGLRLVDDPSILDRPFYSSMIPQVDLNDAFGALQSKLSYTRLEKMLMVSLDKTLRASGIELSDRVGLILSTTKGNINVLGGENGSQSDNGSPLGATFPKERAYLSVLARVLQRYFGFVTQPIVVSNACVSGVLAIVTAQRLIDQGKFDHVFVVAGDLVTKFIVSGFNSFQALSDAPCRPYCASRSGINIGEVAASILVTRDKNRSVDETFEILGGASCNDANHISGPSRTGEGLFRSVTSALRDANLSPKDIDYISAHGTATLYNDEMEAIAFDRAGLSDTPLNSLKGYFGHTLGASGLLETIIGMHSLYRNTLFASKGFRTLGVSRPLNIIEKTTPKELDTFLKTASGFGGSNTAAIFRKV